MKRLIILLQISFFILLCLTACSNQEEHKSVDKIKVGVIDTSISNNTIVNYDLNHINDIVKENVEDDETHGATTLEIITEQVLECEIYYSMALDSSFTGEIQNATDSIKWCIENNVDIICMSFATTNNNKELQKVVNEANEKGIILIASCINGSSSDCYPAMYDGVISVSEGINTNADVIIEYNDDNKYDNCSELTAYVTGKIANQLSNGNEDIFKIIEDIQEN